MTQDLGYQTCALQDFFQRTLPQRGQDEVTAATNLWQHKRITNKIRDAAVRMTGTDVYKKVRPPGDTRLFMHEQWSLASLVDHNSQLRYNPNEASPAVQQAQVAEALRSIPIPDPGAIYTFREEDKGQLAGPPPQFPLPGTAGLQAKAQAPSQ